MPGVEGTPATVQVDRPVAVVAVWATRLHTTPLLAAPPLVPGADTGEQVEPPGYAVTAVPATGVQVTLLPGFGVVGVAATVQDPSDVTVVAEPTVP